MLKKRHKGQAALFDGITLMLLASLSAALIFSFLGTYGVQEERVIRSAYILNYMQSAMKAFYHIDASTLNSISSEERDSKGTSYNIQIYRDLDGPSGCKKLRDYLGSFTMSDLLKRDLAEENEKLDDKFEGTEVLGLTSVRCGIKELMKPFAFSGHFYAFDVVKGTNAIMYGDNKVPATNYLAFAKGAGEGGMCLAAQRESGNVMSVAAPFNVVFINPDKPPAEGRKIRQYELRVCIWRPKT